jgi:hypothetical protein
MCIIWSHQRKTNVGYTLVQINKQRKNAEGMTRAKRQNANVNTNPLVWLNQLLFLSKFTLKIEAEKPLLGCRPLRGQYKTRRLFFFVFFCFLVVFWFLVLLVLGHLGESIKALSDSLVVSIKGSLFLCKFVERSIQGNVKELSDGAINRRIYLVKLVAQDKFLVTKEVSQSGEVFAGKFKQFSLGESARPGNPLGFLHLGLNHVRDKGGWYQQECHNVRCVYQITAGGG